MSTLISKYGEWGYRLLVLLALAGYWIGTSKATYATRADVDLAIAPVRVDMKEISIQVTSLDRTLLQVVEQNKVNALQDAALKELEARLRVLEIQVRH